MRHNKFHDRVVDLAGKAFTPTHVCDDPLIFSGRAMQRTKTQTAGPTHPPSKNNSESTEHKGDLLIRDLWQNGTNSVHGMRVMNTGTKSHLEKTPEKFLQLAERSEKKMYRRPASINVNTSRPLLPLLMGYWVCRRGLP